MNPDQEFKPLIFHQAPVVRDPGRFPGDLQILRRAGSSPQTVQIPRITVQTVTLSPEKDNTRHALKT